jgi:hypothetical protein
MVMPSSPMSVKFRQAHPARRVLLAEDHVALGAIERPPLRDTTLQRTAHGRPDLGVTTAELLEDRHRAQAGSSLQHRHNLGFPHAGERVGTSAGAGLCLLRRQPRIGFDPIHGGGAETGLRRSGGRGIDVAKTHVQPHLVVGDGEAGQALIPSFGLGIRCLSRPLLTARRHPPLVGTRAPGIA